MSNYDIEKLSDAIADRILDQVGDYRELRDRIKDQGFPQQGRLLVRYSNGEPLIITGMDSTDTKLVIEVEYPEEDAHERQMRKNGLREPAINDITP